MKRTPLIFLIASLLLIFGTVTALAAGQGQAVSPFTISEFSPETPYPGQEVVGTVSYDPANISGEKVEFEILYELAAEGGVAACPGNNCSFTDIDGESTIHFYAPEKEGSYELTITFIVDGQPFAPNIKSLNVESALPEGWAQILAGLGLFAAIMAIMAVGTEVVIETLKMFLGFKSKVTAMEAFDELKTELPGMLAGVGVDADARKKINTLVNRTEGFLKPLEDVDDVLAQIAGGKFADAYKKLDELIAGYKEQKPEDDIEKLKAAAIQKFSESIKSIREKLNLDAKLTGAAEKEVTRIITELTPEKIEDFIKNVYDAIRKILNDPGQVEKWLLGQMDVYITQGKTGLNQFLTEGKEILIGIGFSPDDVEAQFDKAVASVEEVAREKAEVYAHSIKNLLENVEDRRNQMQSPFRKLWRRLRDSHLKGGYVWVILMFVTIPTLVWGIFRIPPLNLLTEEIAWYIYWFDAILLGLGFCILVFLMLGIALLTAKENRSPEPKGENPEKGTLGYVLRYYIERPFNIILGHDASIESAANYGEVESDLVEMIQGTSPTSVASTLLALENKHKDEETTRIRWLRIFSIFIGIYLAYHLKIDAAVYLGYAVTGIEEQINFVELNSWGFFQYWFPKGLTVGMLLTGFAASAGSKFWRDLLGRLQAARGQAEEAAQAVRKVKTTISEFS